MLPPPIGDAVPDTVGLELLEHAVARDADSPRPAVGAAEIEPHAGADVEDAAARKGFHVHRARPAEIRAIAYDRHRAAFQLHRAEGVVVCEGALPRTQIGAGLIEQVRVGGADEVHRRALEIIAHGVGADTLE